MNDKTGAHLLAIYLNDHLLGATAGTDLARRMADTHRSGDAGERLQQLATEVAEDRKTLMSLMARLDVRVDQVKVALGWAGEKLGRLKLNGFVLTRSPLSTVLELESMRLGVEGKAAGWRTLRAIAEHDDRLDTADLDRLIDRANHQIRTLEALRVSSAEHMLAPV